MTKGSKDMSLSSQKNLQARREARIMAKERSSALTVERGFHSESSCMRRQLDEMALLLKRHNISIPASARKEDSEEEEEEEYPRK